MPAGFRRAGGRVPGTPASERRFHRNGQNASTLASSRRGLARRAATVAVAAVLAAAGAASARVTVNPKEAAQGSYTKVAFRVPNETDNASTKKVEVNLPADHPIASVSTQPVFGWTVAVHKSKLTQPIKSDDGEITDAVTKITWTADKSPGVAC